MVNTLHGGEKKGNTANYMHVNTQVLSTIAVLSPWRSSLAPLRENVM